MACARKISGKNQGKSTNFKKIAKDQGNWVTLDHP